MQATADPAGTRDDAPATNIERRPVRLLVPQERSSDYFVSHRDTLRASDLGITRHTTDAEIDEIMAGLDVTDVAWHRDNLIRIRNELGIPRDIAEARAWGYHVPEDENATEFDPNPRKHLGWYWVYDPERTETRDEREARYLADTRIVDMRGVAAAQCRAYITIKDRKVATDNARNILDKADYRRDLAQTYVDTGAAATLAEAEAKLIEEARKDLLVGLPLKYARYGQSDVWTVASVLENGRLTRRLTEWYEFNKVKQSGRPKGSRTKNRRPKVSQPD